MTTPERIWAWRFVPHHQDELVKGGWDDNPDRKLIEYVRRDPAVLAALPEVQAMMRQAYLHGFSASAEGYNREWPFDDKGIDPETDGDWTKDRETALDRIAAAIREGRA